MQYHYISRNTNYRYCNFVSHKRGGLRSEPFEPLLYFPYNRRYFLDTPKWLLSCFKLQKPVSAHRSQKGGVSFKGAYATKKLVPRLFLALQPMYPVGSDEEAAGGVLVNSAFLTHHATDGIKFYQGLVLSWAYGYRTVAGG